MRRTLSLALLGVLALTAAPPAPTQRTARLRPMFFEDRGATAGDSSVFGNIGTVQGAVRALRQARERHVVDGVDDSVMVPDAGSINLASGMTVEAWVNPSTLNGWRTIALKQRLTNVSYGLDGSSAWLRRQLPVP